MPCMIFILIYLIKHMLLAFKNGSNFTWVLAPYWGYVLLSNIPGLLFVTASPLSSSGSVRFFMYERVYPDINFAFLFPCVIWSLAYGSTKIVFIILELPTVLQTILKSSSCSFCSMRLRPYEYMFHIVVFEYFFVALAESAVSSSVHYLFGIFFFKTLHYTTSPSTLDVRQFKHTSIIRKLLCIAASD